MSKKILSVLVLIITCFAFVLVGCTSNLKQFTVEVEINGANFGTVNGGGKDIVEGSEVSISASPKEDHKFFCWIHGNKVVATKPDHKFNLNVQTAGKYTAIFKSPDLEFICIDSIAFTNGSAEVENATLNYIEIYIGYNQNNLTKVYSSDKSNIIESTETLISSETLYETDKLPYTFDKQEKLYINIIANYSLGEIELVSNSIRTINGVEVGTSHKNLETTTLDIAKNPQNSNVILENSNTSTIEITFKKLSDFTFETEEESQQPQE